MLREPSTGKNTRRGDRQAAQGAAHHAPIHHLFRFAPLVGTGLLVAVLACSRGQTLSTPAPMPTFPLPEGSTATPYLELTPEDGAPASSPEAIVPSPTSPSSQQPAVGSDQPSASAHYAFVVDLNYTGHTATVSQTVEVTNNTPDTWDRLVFHVPVSRVPGTFQLGSFVWQDGAILSSLADLQTLTYIVTLSQPFPPGATGSLQIDYTLNIPRTSHEDWPPTGDLGYNDQVTQFGNWYPVLVPYRAGQGWYTWPFTEVGDPYVTEVAAYDLEVRAPPDVVVASGGQSESVEVVWRFHLDLARSIGFSASPYYQVTCEQAGGVPVCSYYLAGHETTGLDVLHATVQSVELFSDLYGPYPYASLTVAQDAFFGSMEYTAFILHSGEGYARYDGDPASMLIALTAHEVAHQWWYSLVGTDQVNEPWLDEGLAMYSEIAYYRTYHPHLEDWFWESRVFVYDPQGPLDRSIYDFPDSQTYIHQLYRRGALFYDALRGAMGREAFYAFLQELRAGGENRLITTDEFFQVLDRYGGGSYTALIEEYFPGRAAAGSPPTPDESGFIEYVVQQGDTLTKIAQKFGVTVEAIKQANGLVDDTIYPGQVLKIPQS